MQMLNASKSLSISLETQIQALQRFLEKANGHTVVLSGAGISTDSGIPDYRGPQGVYVKNKNYVPIQFQQFLRDSAFRQRYWARSFLGWPKISNAQPNASHFALTSFQISQHMKSQYLSSIITQNVDALHKKSGSNDVIELHGTLHEVVCLSCSHIISRQQLQEELILLNPEAAHYLDTVPLAGANGDVASSINEKTMQRPDGDVEITWSYDKFQYPKCSVCGGLLKPRVVFFGENVPIQTREAAELEIETNDAILVIGSSLQVLSAMRLIRQAKARQMPIAIINLGPTRADEIADIKIDAPAAAILTKLVTQ